MKLVFGDKKISHPVVHRDDADNVWGNFTTSDTATIGVDAQYGTAVTWDYYKNVHGRNGIANNGTGAEASVVSTVPSSGITSRWHAQTR